MGFESATSYIQTLLPIHSAIAATQQLPKLSYQVFKCRTTQHKEIKSNLTRDLTLTFDSSLAPRGPNPNPNVHHKENNVYPNPNLTSSYILTLTLTSIIRLYPNPNANVQHEETSDRLNKFLYTLAGDRQNIHFVFLNHLIMHSPISGNAQKLNSYTAIANHVTC